MMTYRPKTGLRMVGLFLGLAVAALAAYGNETEDARPTRRYGLFVGANNGGSGRARLAYAETDSRAMARVMQDVGGMSGADTVVLVDPEVADVRRSIADMGARIRKERSDARRVEFLFYYSGHSDEEALMMGESRLGYSELRDSVRGLETDLSIAILDSCASGAFTRLKGGQRGAPFLVDESSAVQGQVYLTSSSEDEASQESDTLGGSFFTHSLVSALRGAADFSLDGKVTLHEAYQYAAADTLARTENTQAGAQHPSWYINLTGTGDLVLTDLRSTTAALTMSEEVSGTVFIRDARGNLVAEVRKLPGQPLTLALPPGTYTVSTRTERSAREARIVLQDGARTELAATDFREGARLTATRSRGEEGSPYLAQTDPETDWTRADEDRAREAVRELDPGGFERFFEGLGELGTEIGTRVRERVNASLEAARERESRARDAEMEALGETPWTRPGKQEAGGGNADDVSLVPFSVGLFPGATYPAAGSTRKVISVNVLIGLSHTIAGFEASGIMNVTSHDVTGGQAAGVGNIVSGRLAGYQGAGVFNIAGGPVSGVQTAGVFNIARQSRLLVQVGGVFNMTDSSLDGAQTAGVFNIAGGMAGAQVAGVFNMANGVARGLQVGGVFNYADSVAGGQVGTANVTKILDGAQVGVFNYAGKARGVQIGVVNVASSLKGVPIGLINVIGDGLILGSVGWDDRGFNMVEITTGTRLYTYLGFGVQLSDAGDPTAVSGQLGLGAHLPLGPFFVAGDLSARSVVGIGPAPFAVEDAIPFPTMRGRVGMLLFGVVGGYIGYAVDTHMGSGVPINSIAHTGEGTVVTIGDRDLTLYPRFVAGISVGRQPK